MKKIFIITSTLALTLVLSGCALKNTNQNPADNSASNNQPSDQKSSDDIQKSRDDFSQWMSKTSGVECTVTTDLTTIDVKTKDGKTRLDEANKNDSSLNDTTLNDGQFVYMWSGSDGIKYPSHLDNKTGDDWDWSDDEGVLLDQAAQNKYECKDSELDDSVFAVPQDVTFSQEQADNQN